MPNSINKLFIFINSDIMPIINEANGTEHNATALKIDATLARYSRGTFFIIITCNGKLTISAPIPKINVSIANNTYIYNSGKLSNNDIIEYVTPTKIPPNINIFLFPNFSFIAGAKIVVTVTPINKEILIIDNAIFPTSNTSLTYGACNELYGTVSAFISKRQSFGTFYQFKKYIKISR